MVNRIRISLGIPEKAVHKTHHPICHRQPLGTDQRMDHAQSCSRQQCLYLLHYTASHCVVCIDGEHRLDHLLWTDRLAAELYHVVY